MRDEGSGQHEDHRGGEKGHALKIKMITLPQSGRTAEQQPQLEREK